MGRRSRTQNAVYTAFSCRGQLHYMDGLRTFKRETRLSFIGGKFARRYLRTNCNIRCLLIEPAGDRSVSLKAIPARGTSHFVLVASRAGNFALRARDRADKSAGEKRPSRFSFIGDVNNSCALLGIIYSCIFPLIAVSYTYIIKLNTNKRPAGFGRRIRCQTG